MKKLLVILIMLSGSFLLAAEPKCTQEAENAADSVAESHNADFNKLSFYSETKKNFIKEYELNGEGYDGDYDPSNYPEDAEIWILYSSARGGSAETVITLNITDCVFLGADILYSE